MTHAHPYVDRQKLIEELNKQGIFAQDSGVDSGVVLKNLAVMLDSSWLSPAKENSSPPPAQEDPVRNFAKEIGNSLITVGTFLRQFDFKK